VLGTRHLEFVLNDRATGGAADVDDRTGGRKILRATSAKMTRRGGFCARFSAVATPLAFAPEIIAEQRRRM